MCIVRAVLHTCWAVAHVHMWFAGSDNADMKKKQKKGLKEGKKKTKKGKAAASDAEIDGNNLAADLGDVDATHNAGMLAGRPQAQPAVPHHKDGVSAEPRRAPTAPGTQTADPASEAAPQTSQALSLQAWVCRPADSPTHSVVSRAPAHLQSAPSPAALQDAPSLQVGKCLVTHSRKDECLTYSNQT